MNHINFPLKKKSRDVEKETEDVILVHFFLGNARLLISSEIFQGKRK